MPAIAQEDAGPGDATGGDHQHDDTSAPASRDAAQQASDAQDHSQHGAAAMAFAGREGSGTAWLPGETPMYGIHQEAGGWQLMWHGNAFAQYLSEGGDRGRDQAGSVNWIMGMARRGAAGGRLGLRGMLSLEPWSIPGCGYPDLLATGETCGGEAIHDRQHPHDLFMEMAAEYERPIRGSLGWQVYGALAGEPALGPVAFPHRTSAMPNPVAPIAHHWLDATHITFGVVTAGVYDGRWKAEASVFNGREPDEHRADLDLAALDSFSGRFWFAPHPSMAIQVSAGRLHEAEPGHESGPRVDVDRVTASLGYHRRLGARGIWATTLAWGRNLESGEATHAGLVESVVTVNDLDTVFARLEVVEKSAHDLDIHGTDEAFTVSKLQVGYTRYLGPWGGLSPGIGAAVSVGIVPRELEPFYGKRANPGGAVFVTLRPAAHGM
jgi:hypothetical protein